MAKDALTLTRIANHDGADHYVIIVAGYKLGRVVRAHDSRSFFALDLNGNVAGPQGYATARAAARAALPALLALHHNH